MGGELASSLYIESLGARVQVIEAVAATVSCYVRHGARGEQEDERVLARPRPRPRPRCRPRRCRWGHRCEMVQSLDLRINPNPADRAQATLTLTHGLLARYDTWWRGESKTSSTA